MGVIIIDTLQRGGSGVSPFPVIKEEDSSVSYVVVADLTARNAIEEWKRRSHMECYVISTGLSYRLGSDLTIVGQVWTEIPGVGSGFQLLSEKGQPDGYTPLNASGKIDASYIQDIYTNASHIAASEPAMLALATQTGDIVTRTDTSQIFVKLNNNAPPTVIGDFAELLFPGAVLSVNGQTGAVDITITNLLAWGTNQTLFDNAVTASPTITANSGAIATNQADILALQGSIGIEPVITDKNQTPLASAGNESPTGITITSTPVGYVEVSVNGAQQNLEGGKSGDCYFSADGGTTAKTLSTIAAGDQLIWNGVIAGFELLVSFKVDLNYNA